MMESQSLSDSHRSQRKKDINKNTSTISINVVKEEEEDDEEPSLKYERLGLTGAVPELKKDSASALRLAVSNKLLVICSSIIL